MQLAAIFAQADIAYVDGRHDYIPVVLPTEPSGTVICSLVPRMKGDALHFNDQEVALGPYGKIGMTPDRTGVFHQLQFFKMEPLEGRHLS